jgi:UDP-GlcNAc:undecaprenyl-phosphate GlcNAc-1-phosphate transferase
MATTLAVLCFQAGQGLGVILGAALVGALLGFLPFNFSPARIFLGDAGSLFIGFALSLLALDGYRKAALLTFLVPMMVLAVPIMDTLLSILRRVRSGKPVFSADRNHMHHRLLQREGSHSGAVLQLYFMTACFSLIAVRFSELSGVVAIAILIAVVVLTLRLLVNLGIFAAESEEVDSTEAGGVAESKER